jgi:hypothetical protein
MDMFTKHPKAAALGGLLTGSVLVGAVTLGMGVAHGATNGGSKSTGRSDSQYQAKHAWAQPSSSGPNISLSIPEGDRLTITDAIENENGYAVSPLS